MAKQSDGFCYAFEVRQSVGKGLGVFAKEAIKKGSIVWRHVHGQYTVYDEKTFKTLLAGMTTEDAEYELTHVFGLEDFPDCLVRVFDPGVLFNHEKVPNLVTNNQTALETSLDPESPDYIQCVTDALLDDRYAMIATRDIQIGEEFTNNYEQEADDPPSLIFFTTNMELRRLTWTIASDVGQKQSGRQSSNLSVF